MTDENTVNLWNKNQNEITNLCYYLDEENPIVELSSYALSQNVVQQAMAYKKSHNNDDYAFGWNPICPFELVVWSSSYCYHKRVEENEQTDFVLLDVESMEIIFKDIRKQALSKAEKELTEAEEKRLKAEREKKIGDFLVTRIRQVSIKRKMGGSNNK